jgi:hemerythrin
VSRDLLQNAGAEVVIDLLHEVRNEQRATTEALRAMTERLAEHTLADERIMKDLFQAFPESDTEGHRRYHQQVIENMALRNEVVRACLKAAASAGLITGMGFTLKALWYYVTGAPK